MGLFRYFLSDANRGVFAEFLVGAALGLLDKPRIEWDAASNTSLTAPIRPADCYVFCVYTEKNEADARKNLLNVAYWDFYPVHTELLNQHFATKHRRPSSLMRLGVEAIEQPRQD